MSRLNESTSATVNDGLGEIKTIKNDESSFFQRFVARTVRKSPSNLSSSSQQRPGLLTTLFGNPIQHIFRKKAPIQSLDRQPSYALVRTNPYEEGHDFEICDDLIPATAPSPSSIAIGNGTGGNNFYRPPRSYHQRAVVVSTHNDSVIEQPHALKTEVRVLSAPKHPKPVRLPPTPPKAMKKASSATPPTKNKISIPNGGAPRKISAPVGPPSVHAPVSKKFSVAGTASMKKASRAKTDR